MVFGLSLTPSPLWFQDEDQDEEDSSDTDDEDADMDELIQELDSPDGAENGEREDSPADEEVLRPPAVQAQNQQR